MVQNINSNNSVEGAVSFDKNIMYSIVELAIKEIEGISSLAANFGYAYSEKLFAKNNKGIKITTDEHRYNIDIYVNVYYGYNVSEISYKVQTNVKSSLQSMLPVEIDKINVHVLGVDFKTINA